MANLNTHDIINMSSEYGKRLTAAIELEYDFTIRGYLPIPEISLTSKKALLQTDKGTFFLKEKPFYCTSPDSLFRSFTFQDYCASYSDKMVAIKKTKNNQHYISFEKSIFFITLFKSGTGFSGKPEDLSKMFDVLVELRKIGRGYLQEYSDKSDYLPENESRRPKNF